MAINETLVVNSEPSGLRRKRLIKWDDQGKHTCRMHCSRPLLESKLLLQSENLGWIGCIRSKSGWWRKGHGCAWLLRQKLWPFHTVYCCFIRTSRPYSVRPSAVRTSLVRWARRIHYDYKKLKKQSIKDKGKKYKRAFLSPLEMSFLNMFRDSNIVLLYLN
jgi:hypothetical protein